MPWACTTSPVCPPEAKELGESLITEGTREYIIDGNKLERAKNNYPVVWKNPDVKPKLCFIGCPLMYGNNPLAGKMPVITCSNKLRTYTTARYYTEEEIPARVTKGGTK